MKQIKAILFDMDGVLILSEDLHYKIKKQLFKRYNCNMTEEEYNLYCAGMRTKESIEVYLKAKGKPINEVPFLVEEFRRIKREELEKGVKKVIKLRKGTEEVLQELKKKYVLAITTSAIREFTEKILEAHNIKQHFTKIVTAEDVKKGKPNPEPYLTTAKKVGIEPKNCVVIEDAVNGVEAAKAAGMFCIAIVDKKEKDEQFSKADCIIRDVKEILNLLKT